MLLIRNRLLIVIIATISGLIASQRSYGWGADGHRIVALIAAARLTPQAAAEVKKLFDTDPLDAWASWPDEIRNDRPETAPWHFVDIPASQPSFDATRDGNNGSNIIDALNRNEKTLGDHSASKVARAEALSFVTHLIGDVHQPLHTADRNGDKGGNKRLVFILDQPRATNLHSAWDSGILKLEMGSTSDPVFASGLNARISHADAEKWSQGSITDWVNQSHELAVNAVYAGIPENGPPPRLGKDYLARAVPVINEQLERGGVRLASELNRILGAPPTTTQATTQASMVNPQQ